jgi:hypothetical protein
MRHALCLGAAVGGRLAEVAAKVTLMGDPLAKPAQRRHP